MREEWPVKIPQPSENHTLLHIFMNFALSNTTARLLEEYSQKKKEGSRGEARKWRMTARTSSGLGVVRRKEALREHADELADASWTHQTYLTAM